MINNEFAKIYYHQEDNLVYLEWKSYCNGKMYQMHLNHITDLFIKNSAETLIINANNGFENEEAENSWISETFIPNLLHTSCNKIIFRIDDDNEFVEEIEMHAKSLNEYFTVEVTHEW